MIGYNTCTFSNVLLAFESTSDHACNDIHVGFSLWTFGDAMIKITVPSIEF